MPATRTPAPPKNAKRRRQIELLREGPPDAVAYEVGVHKGAHAALILEHMRPRSLTLIDPWAWSQQWHAQHDERELAAIEEGRALPGGDAIYESVRARFEGDPRVEIIRAGSLEAAEHVPDASADWVFIDGDHRYEPALADLHAWWPKLKPGGVLTGDDFAFKCLTPHAHPNGVAAAVHAFISGHLLDLDLRYLRGDPGDPTMNYQFVIRKPA